MMTTMMTEDDVATAAVYDQCRGWFRNEESVTAGSMIRFTLYVMTVAQRVVEERNAGPYKKRVVLTVMRRVLDRDIDWGTPEQEAAIVAMMESTVPTLIDTSVAVAKGEVDLAKRGARVWKACFPCCFDAD